MLNWYIYRPPKVLKFANELRWSKSLRLLQRVAFLVFYEFLNMVFSKKDSLLKPKDEILAFNVVIF